jgi:hypothetical protein
MYLDHVTITGADDHVDRNALYELSDKYPFVQWGILYYSEKEGKPRYPSNEWVEKFDRYAPDFVSKNVHLCGSDAKAFCNGDLSIVRYSAYGSPSYESIQVNIPEGFAIATKPQDVADLFIRSCIVIPTIIQMNDYTRPIVDALQKKESGNFTHILFDESRGKGKMIDIPDDGGLKSREMYSLLKRSQCGFAGGIGPDNVVKVLDTITKVSNLHYDVRSELMGYNHSPPGTWIDMESGVRTDNEFDLKKVEKVLETVDKWMRGM